MCVTRLEDCSYVFDCKILCQSVFRIPKCSYITWIWLDFVLVNYFEVFELFYNFSFYCVTRDVTFIAGENVDKCKLIISLTFSNLIRMLLFLLISDDDVIFLHANESWCTTSIPVYVKFTLRPFCCFIDHCCLLFQIQWSKTDTLITWLHMHFIETFN